MTIWKIPSGTLVYLYSDNGDMAEFLTEKTVFFNDGEDWKTWHTNHEKAEKIKDQVRTRFGIVPTLDIFDLPENNRSWRYMLVPNLRYYRSNGTKLTSSIRPTENI